MVFHFLITMQEFKKQSAAILEHFQLEIASLRTGRATPALVEDINVESYGAKMPLKALASISLPDPRSLLITPWDKTNLPAIEKAIQSSSLGVNPITDKNTIRIAIPPLTEERRKEMAKILGRLCEDARIQVRKAREEHIREISRNAEAEVISEDEQFRKKNEIQKIVDETNIKIEDMRAAKEKEIMTV
mgnify:CR=1 FL=1